MNEAQQVLRDLMADQLQKSSLDALERLQNKLSEAVLRLESDEVIQQMRNDPNLQEFKRTRAKELLSEVFAAEKQIISLSRSNAQLKNNLFLAEVEKNKQAQMIRLKEQQYVESLEDIEAKFSHYRQQVQMENNQNKRELLKLEETHASCDDRAVALQNRCTEYEGALKAMQGDMLLIKTKWEQRCQEIEEEMRVRNRAELEQLKKHYQGKITQLVEEYARCSKDGKAMIVQPDQEIMREIRGEAIEIRSRYAQLEQKNDQAKREIESFKSENAQLKSCVLEQRDRQNKLIGEIKSHGQKYHEQIRIYQDKVQELRVMQRDLSSAKKEIEQLRSEVKKQERLRKQLEEEQLRELEDIRDRVERQSEDSRIKQNTEIVTLKELMKQKNEQLEQMETEYQTLLKTEGRLKQQINSRDQIIIEQQTKISTAKLRTQTLREKHRRLHKALENCRLPIQRLHNENNLLREQIKYQLEVYKRKLQSEMIEIANFFASFRDKLQQKNSQRLTSLLMEVEDRSRRESQALDKANADNDVLRNRINEYERVFEEKLIEIKEDVRLKETDASKISSELQKTREAYIRAQVERDEIFVEFERELRQFKKQILKLVRTSRIHSNQDLHELILDEFRMKDKEIDRISKQSRQKEDFIEELERKIQSSRLREEDMKAHLSEIEILKERCHGEEQVRKKLQKELKDLRMEILCKQGVIQELTKMRKDKENISKNIREEKEKELEEIRAMIVKTYEVVGAKQDIPERGKRSK